MCRISAKETTAGTPQLNKQHLARGAHDINEVLDDGWERSPRQGDALYEGPARDEEGHFIPNKKFPDMKALGDYIHSLGLKFGIYSSPGPTTCQGLEASFRHEEKDVMQWCSWGVDYLKYDWCSYRAETNGLDGLKKPYKVMRAVLNQAPRDIVFSICQYGNGNVWEWGANPDVGGNSWRTTSDIRDHWPQVSAIGFHPGPRGSDVDLSPFAAGPLERSRHARGRRRRMDF